MKKETLSSSIVSPPNELTKKTEALVSGSSRIPSMSTGRSTARPAIGKNEENPVSGAQAETQSNVPSSTSQARKAFKPPVKQIEKAPVPTDTPLPIIQEKVKEKSTEQSSEVNTAD